MAVTRALPLALRLTAGVRDLAWLGTKTNLKLLRAITVTVTAGPSHGASAVRRCRASGPRRFPGGRAVQMHSGRLYLSSTCSTSSF